MAYGNQQFRQQALATAGAASPFAASIRRSPAQGAGGLGSLFGQLGMAPQRAVSQGSPSPQNLTNMQMLFERMRGGSQSSNQTTAPSQASQPMGQIARRIMPQQPANPFEGNEQYQALMDFQKSLAPNQEQQTRLQELQSAFEGTGAFKDYRINQLQQQLQQRQPRNPMMGMGLGGMRPMGMQPYQGFGRPPMVQRPLQQPMRQPSPSQIPMNAMGGGYGGQQPMRQFGAAGFNQPQQQYMNPYQQMRPQPQQFGGYGMGQQMGGYGSYGQMPNPYQPQQMGYNTNNYSNYAQPAQNQFQGYGGMQAQSQGVF